MTVVSGSTANITLARMIGILFLVQMFAGIWLNFFFYKPLFADPLQLDDGTVRAMVGSGMLLAMLLSAINFIVCLASRPLLKERFKDHFVAALSLTAIALCLTMMEGNRFSELTYWTLYINNLEPDSLLRMGEADHFRQLLATGRNTTHYTAIIVSSLSLLMFYSLLLRARLLPLPLMYFAVIACLLQVIAVGHALFGQPIPNLLQLPLAINQLILPIHLFFWGFRAA